MAPHMHRVVVGVDIGTAQTGYAYAFMGDRKRDIYTNKTWPGGFPDRKTITSILLENENVIAFGYPARDKFAADPKPTYQYFETFKMILHDREGATRSIVQAENNNNKVSVITLMSKSIAEVRKRVLEEVLSNTAMGVTEDEILWVITVPAIWDQAARNVMLRAAIGAGLVTDSIMIALEPEVASLTCLKSLNNEEALKSDLFMVVDAGGGTIDITVYQQTPGNQLKEICAPSGGPWGSTFVNKEFESVLLSVFGKDFVSKHKGSPEWIHTLDKFEHTKIMFNNNDDVRLVNVAALLVLGVTPETKTYKVPDIGEVSYIRGNIRIPSQTLVKLFNSTIPRIINHIDSLIVKVNHMSEDKIKYLFLVGGFSDSPLLQQEIKKAFSTRINIITPPRSSAAVLMGAVQYGLDPSVIVSRVAPRTIAISTCSLFDPKEHFGRPKIINEIGEERVNILDIFVKCGHNIDTEFEIKKSYMPLNGSQSFMNFIVYSSDRDNVKYPDDAGLKRLGSLTMEVGEGEISTKSVMATIKFGGTTFAVTATNIHTGAQKNAEFSYILGV